MSRRIVFTDPNLAPDITRYSASDFFGISPNDLGVVAAGPVAPIGSVIVVSGFRRPHVNNLLRRRMRASDVKKVLAIRRLGIVKKPIPR